jgi:hypothetical protein
MALLLYADLGLVDVTAMTEEKIWVEIFPMFRKGKAGQQGPTSALAPRRNTMNW